MAFGPTPGDLQRQMSDPTRYGVPVPYPQAAPAPAPSPAASPLPQGAIPGPGAPPPQAQAQPAPAAQEGPPRPQGDSGYYNKPDPQSLGEAIKLGLDKITSMVSGQQPGGPAVGQDPRQQVAQNAYARNVMAPDPASMQEAYRASDPEGKLSTEELQLKTLQDATDYWLAHGRPDRAANAAAGVLLYGKKVAATHGFMALTAIKDGNMEKAAQILQKGYGYIPDGKSAQYQVGPDGQVQFWFVDAEGNPSQKQVLTPEIAGNLATAMANGSGWLQQLLAASSGGRGGGYGGGAGSAKAAQTAQAQEALQAMTTAGDQLAQARESGDAEAIKQAEDNFATTYQQALTVPSISAQAQRLASTIWPEKYGKQGGGRGAKGPDLEAQVTQAEQQADQAIQAENDPQKKAILTARRQFIRPFLTYAAQKDVKKIDEQRLDAAVGEFATGDLADLDAQTKQVIRMTAAAILRKTNESAPTVIAAIDAARKGARATVLPDGRIQIAGYPAVYMDEYVFSQLRALRQAYQKANPNAAPPAATTAPSTPAVPGATTPEDDDEE